MIEYDSHKLETLLQRRGSVFPQALKSSLVLTVVVFVVKFLETEGYFGIKFEEVQFVANSAVYSGFSFTLGFILVFRTSQAYNRFQVSATSVYRMRSQWSEAVAGLVTFAEMSKFDREQITKFQQRVVRLFSMLHATALAAVAKLEDERFEVMDVQAFDTRDLEFVMRKGEVEKVEVVYQWIQALTVQHMASGFLNVPPPILTRVFQELERGMTEFHELLMIMQIQFPFPYAQVTCFLIGVHAVITCFVMCLWTSQAWCAAVFTFISQLCIISVDLIATELENPFGDDPNDLPVHTFHMVFNETLALILHPSAHKPPTIRPDASMKMDDIVDPRRSVSLLDLAGDLNVEKALGISDEEDGDPEVGLAGNHILPKEKVPAVNKDKVVSVYPRKVRGNLDCQGVALPHGDQDAQEAESKASKELKSLVQSLSKLEHQVEGPLQAPAVQLGSETHTRHHAAGITNLAVFDEFFRRQEVQHKQFLLSLEHSLRNWEQSRCEASPNLNGRVKALWVSNPGSPKAAEEDMLLNSPSDCRMGARPVCSKESTWKSAMPSTGRTLPHCLGIEP